MTVVNIKRTHTCKVSGAQQGYIAVIRAAGTWLTKEAQNGLLGGEACGGT